MTKACPRSPNISENRNGKVMRVNGTKTHQCVRVVARTAVTWIYFPVRCDAISIDESLEGVHELVRPKMRRRVIVGLQHFDYRWDGATRCALNRHVVAECEEQLHLVAGFSAHQFSQFLAKTYAISAQYLTNALHAIGTTPSLADEVLLGDVDQEHVESTECQLDLPNLYRP